MGYLEKHADTITAWVDSKPDEDNFDRASEMDEPEEVLAEPFTPRLESQVSLLTGGLGLWCTPRPAAAVNDSPLSTSPGCAAIRG